MSDATVVSLKPNGHGGYFIRQSDLSSWSRCARQKMYRDQAQADPTAVQERALSATQYGTVVHYALMQLEKGLHAGRDDALDVAIATFEHYWNPANIDTLPGARQVEDWLPRQTYGGLRDRGRATLELYHTVISKEDSRLLALEYEFAVPLIIDGRRHTLTGTVDRLSIKRWYGTPYLSIDDFKTGKQPYYLRHHIQGTAYSYASHRPEFWMSSENPDLPTFDAETHAALEHYFAQYRYRLHAGTKRDWWKGVTETEIDTLSARRFRWINMQTVKFADGGWRGEVDYQRLALIVSEYVKTNEAGLFNFNLTGEVCVYCPFNHVCGGVGIPDSEHGQPVKRYSTKEG